MKKNCVKKLFSCVLAATLTTGVLVGCGSTGKEADASETSSSAVSSQETSTQTSVESENAAEETGVTYPLKESVTLTLAMVGESAVTTNYEDLAATPFGQAWMEATGVELVIEQYVDSAALNLMLAGGELPDIVMFDWSRYNGGIGKAIRDGIVLPITEYLEYCPDLTAVLDSNEKYRKGATNAAGDIVGFPFIRGDEYLLTSMGMIIREDFLNAVGKELPENPDELYDVLKAFKEELNVEYPLSTSAGYIQNYAIGAGQWTSAFGLVKGDLYVKDGQVHYGFYEDEYKDVLTYLKKLYDEGLIDPNCATLGIDVSRANIMNGVSGMTFDTAGGGMGTMLSTMADDQDFDITGIAPFAAEGGISMSTYYDNPLTSVFAVITTECEEVEAAVQFLNYAYTEEGHMLFNFGIEGECYEMVDNYPVYTDLILNNPEGLSVQMAMAGYMRSWSTGPFVQNKAYMEQYAGQPAQREALTAWTTSDAATYTLPTLTIAEEFASEYSAMLSDVKTCIWENLIAFMTGTKNLDEFEEYQQTLKDMGIERIIEINQIALDEYNAR